MNKETHPDLSPTNLNNSNNNVNHSSPLTNYQNSSGSSSPTDLEKEEWIKGLELLLQLPDQCYEMNDVSDPEGQSQLALWFPVLQAPPTPDWKTGFSFEYRENAVYTIMMYIMHQPDPAVYSDPRMTAYFHDPRMIKLIAYARYVEGVTFITANSRQEYYQLILERSYVAYKELEEARQRRQNAATSGNGTASAAGNDSTLSAPNVSSNSVDSGSDCGITQNLGSVASGVIACSSTMACELEQAEFGAVKKEDDDDDDVEPSRGSSFIADSNEPPTATLSKDMKKVAAEDFIGPIGSRDALINATSFTDNAEDDEWTWKKLFFLVEALFANKNVEWCHDPYYFNLLDCPEAIELYMEISAIGNNPED